MGNSAGGQPSSHVSRGSPGATSTVAAATTAPLLPPQDHLLLPSAGGGDSGGRSASTRCSGTAPSPIAPPARAEKSRSPSAGSSSCPPLTRKRGRTRSISASAARLPGDGGGDRDGGGSSGGAGGAREEEDVPGVRATKSRKRQKEEAKPASKGAADKRRSAAGGGAGACSSPGVPRRSRQRCALIPDSVIAKVPRLLMDLQAVLGYRVFADDAKARCRELPRCGEGLSQQGLCAALISLLSQQATRDNNRLANSPNAGSGGSQGEDERQRQDRDGAGAPQERSLAALKRLPARAGQPPLPAADTTGSGEGAPVGVSTKGKQDREKSGKEGSGGGAVAGEPVGRAHVRPGARPGSSSPSPLETAGRRGGGGGTGRGGSEEEVEQERHEKVAEGGEANRRDTAKEQGKSQKGLAGGGGEEDEMAKRVAAAEEGHSGVGEGGSATAAVRSTAPALKKRPRRSSGIFPESVISKVPRLAVDLSSKLGYGVSAAQAKAACRELDHYGDRLTSEELADACVAVEEVGGDAGAGTDTAAGAGVSTGATQVLPSSAVLSPPPLPAPLVSLTVDSLSRAGKGKQVRIPDAVINKKVPRLLLGLEPLLGKPVSVEEVKACLRKLDCCGACWLDSRVRSVLAVVLIGGVFLGRTRALGGHALQSFPNPGYGPRINARSQLPTPGNLLPDGRDISGLFDLDDEGTVGYGTSGGHGRPKQKDAGTGSGSAAAAATESVPSAASAPSEPPERRAEVEGRKVSGAPLSAERLECEVGEFVVFPTPPSSPVPFLLGKVVGTKVLTFEQTGGPVRTEVTGLRRAQVAAAAALSVARYTSGGFSGVFVPVGGGGSGGTKRLRSDTGEEDLAAAMVVFPRLLQSN
ncbi:unnamed protein product, partial [Scytosiphon promiscuus]